MHVLIRNVLELQILQILRKFFYVTFIIGKGIYPKAFVILKFRQLKTAVTIFAIKL